MQTSLFFKWMQTSLVLMPWLLGQPSGQILKKKSYRKALTLFVHHFVQRCFSESNSFTTFILEFIAGMTQSGAHKSRPWTLYNMVTGITYMCNNDFPNWIPNYLFKYLSYLHTSSCISSLDKIYVLPWLFYFLTVRRKRNM